MTEEQWSMVESYFDLLRQAPAAEQAAAVATISDEAVRLEVESLLRHVGGTRTIASAVGAMASAADLDGLQKRRLGPYRLVRRLGQGGQGAVFEAARDDGTFQQRVAIKIVKWDVDSKIARDRFRQERQILAGLEHPNVARLLDGGETDDGVPYLVMEYVEGLPLTAAAVGWPLRRKLELFLKVASAVAFAHRNLIVHRDLKPANILVTPDGTPKLLDFGIAKLVDSDAQRTATGYQALTPSYASPEQVRGLPISTASDVYTLGLVLYELLTGGLPYTVSSLSPSEIERAVCESKPAPAHISEDLDNILAMALRKEPDRRYAGVAELAQDIERSMADLPVRARPDTIRYRAAKFGRRNRWPIGASAMLVLTLAWGIAASQSQARIARQRFDQVRQLANTFLFSVDESIRDLPGSTAGRELIVRTGLQYLDSLAAGAGRDLDLKLELAGAYEKVADVQGNPSMPNLGHSQAALDNYRKSRTLAEDVLAKRAADPKALRALAQVTLKTGDLHLVSANKAAAHEDFEIARKAVSQVAAVAPTDAPLEFMGGGANLRLGDEAKKDPLAAIPFYEKARDAYQRAYQSSPSTRYRNAVVIAGRRVGLEWLLYGNPAKALPHLQAGLTILRELASANPNSGALQRSLANALVDYGDVHGLPGYFNLGDPAIALSSYREARLIYDRLTQSDPKSVLAATDSLFVLNRIGAVLLRVHPAEAVQTLEDSLRLQTRLGAAATRKDIAGSLAVTHQRLAEVFLAERKFEAGLREAKLAVSPKSEPADSMREAIVLGDLQAASGQADAAKATWRGAILMWQVKDPQREQASWLRDRAELLERVAGEGCAEYREALALWEECARRGAPREQVDGPLARLRKQLVSCGSAAVSAKNP